MLEAEGGSQNTSKLVGKDLILLFRNFGESLGPCIIKINFIIILIICITYFLCVSGCERILCWDQRCQCYCGQTHGSCRLWRVGDLWLGTLSRSDQYQSPRPCCCRPSWPGSCSWWWGRGCHGEARPRSTRLTGCWCWRSWVGEAEAQDDPGRSFQPGGCQVWRRCHPFQLKF